MKYVGILGLLSVALVGFGYYTLFVTPANETINQVERDQAEFAQERTEVTSKQDAEPRKGVGTLDYLRLLNEDLECTIVYEPQEGQESVEGTYFVNDGRMRGGFLTAAPDLSGQILSSMIIADSTIYVWSEINGENYGIQMPLTALQDETQVTNEPIELDADVTYDCAVWENVDNTVFLPPTDVLFQDLESLMNVGMEYSTVYPEGEF
jgi:hypothetical protein